MIRTGGPFPNTAVPPDALRWSVYVTCVGVLLGSSAAGCRPLLTRELIPPWRIFPNDADEPRCSGGEVIGSISSDTVAEDAVSFTVAITEVKVSVEDDLFPFLGDVYIGGY